MNINTHKKSGIDWIGEVPIGWDIKRLKYIFRIRKDIVGELGHKVLSITNKGVKVKDIDSGEGQISSDYSKYQKVKIGDFAMNHMDLLTGWVDISKYKGVTSPDYRVFEVADKSVVPEYYLYVLQLCYLHRIFFPYGQGAAHVGRWRLPSDEFRNFYVPYPSKEEQKNIVKYIDHEMAGINELSDEYKKMLSLLAEKRKALVFNASMDEETVWSPLRFRSNLVSRPIQREPSEYYKPIGLFNRGRGLFHKKMVQGKELGDSKFFFVSEGDLIISGQFAWEGAVAIAGTNEENCVVSHRYPILRGVNGLNTIYLWAYFTTDHGNFLLNQNSNGAAGRNRPLNIRTLLKEKVPVPKMELQQKIVDLVRKERLLKQEIEEIEKLLKIRRISLINSALTGKIELRNKEVA
jgi:type I restriction enzyme S subunit